MKKIFMCLRDFRKVGNPWKIGEKLVQFKLNKLAAWIMLV